MFFSLTIQQILSINRLFFQGTELGFTVATKPNQGTFHHRVVFDGGALFGYSDAYRDNQKVITKTSRLFVFLIKITVHGYSFC